MEKMKLKDYLDFMKTREMRPIIDFEYNTFKTGIFVSCYIAQEKDQTKSATIKVTADLESGDDCTIIGIIVKNLKIDEKEESLKTMTALIVDISNIKDIKNNVEKVESVFKKAQLSFDYIGYINIMD